MRVRYIFVVCFVVIVLIVIYHFTTAWKVVDSAEKIADNKPYCIQVNGGIDYKEASVLSDLSILSMRSARHGNYHAILVIGDVYKPKLLNWSYQRGGFVSDVHEVPAIYCSPKQRFSKNLTLLPRNQPEQLKFVYSNIMFSIPMDAKPFKVPNNRGLWFADYNGYISSDKQGVVEVDFRLNGISDRLSKVESDRYNIVETTNEYGLIKQSIQHIAGENAKLSYPVYIQYYSESKQPTTIISCPNGLNKKCFHFFQHNGWTYTFKYEPSNISQWKQHEDRVVKLTRSYIVFEQPR